MPKSRRSRRTLTIIVLVVVSLSIISLDLNGRTHSVTSGIKSVANGVFSPLRHGVVDILSPIGDVFAGAVHYGSVQAENATDLMAEPNVDGLLVGGASLQAPSFVDVIRACAACYRS